MLKYFIMITIKKLLTKKQSKSNRDEIVAMIYNNPQLIEELMECFFDKEYRVHQNASWPVGKIGEQRPDLLQPYIHKMVETLDNSVHDAFIRNTVRSFQSIDLPEELEGIVYDKCFTYLNNPRTAVAIRAFSMTVLANIAIKYPELKEELIKTIELYYPNAKPGFKSRAKREIKRLSSKKA